MVVEVGDYLRTTSGMFEVLSVRDGQPTLAKRLSKARVWTSIYEVEMLCGRLTIKAAWTSYRVVEVVPAIEYLLAQLDESMNSQHGVFLKKEVNLRPTSATGKR